MKYFTRDIEDRLISSLTPNKVILLVGPRRTGKTILLEHILDKLTEPYLLFNGEDYDIQQILKKRSVQNYRNILGDRRILIIDEAQKVPDIGNILKLMVDSIDGLKIIVTGSSAFDILNITGEPLTGRKITYMMYPLSEHEFNQFEDFVQMKENMKVRLVYGGYPELLHYPNDIDKKLHLKELVNSYLFKDILTLDEIRNSSKIFDLLRLLAFQVGSLVSYQELANSVGMSSITVEKYLDLLSKVFIIHKVSGYSNNLRKEITKQSKWYFWDNGIRNTLVANLNPVELRNDIGILWENFIISERIKYQSNNNMIVNNFFWRTYDKQEIDWIEERDGNLFAFEFKWSNKKVKIPGAWDKSYPNSSFTVINQDNYREFII